MKKLAGSLLLATAMTTALAPRVHAGATTPQLLMTAAAGTANGAARSAVVDGNFDFANALEVGYPIDLLVFQGSTFARFPFAGTPVSGTSPELADGVFVDTEISALLGEGAAAAPEVRIVTLVPDRIRVTLPASFAAGATTAVVFGILTDGTVLSNAVTFVLP